MITTVKQRYYSLLGFVKFESASRFCTAFDELRNYLRVRSMGGDHVVGEVYSPKDAQP